MYTTMFSPFSHVTSPIGLLHYTVLGITPITIPCQITTSRHVNKSELNLLGAEEWLLEPYFNAILLTAGPPPHRRSALKASRKKKSRAKKRLSVCNPFRQKMFSNFREHFHRFERYFSSTHFAVVVPVRSKPIPGYFGVKWPFFGHFLGLAKNLLEISTPILDFFLKLFSLVLKS